MTHPSRVIASASLLLLGSESPPADLDTRGLKNAYRRMALLTHPDTRRRSGAPDFLRVRQAYEVLIHCLAGRHDRRHVEPKVSTPRSWYWTGGLPTRTLRLGEYLFYQGSIPWDVLIRSIVEQRGARPTLGRLACTLRMIEPAQVARAVSQRGRGERMGEVLVRLGMLSRAALDRLLEEQRRLQRPLGWHLVRLGHVHKGEIPGLLVRLWKHNAAAVRTAGS